MWYLDLFFSLSATQLLLLLPEAFCRALQCCIEQVHTFGGLFEGAIVVGRQTHLLYCLSNLLVPRIIMSSTLPLASFSSSVWIFSGARYNRAGSGYCWHSNRLFTDLARIVRGVSADNESSKQGHHKPVRQFSMRPRGADTNGCCVVVS